MAERVFNDQLGDWKRSCYCGEPRAASVDQELTLVGWVHSRRDHGGVIFVDLRDRSGICQIVFNPEGDAASHEKAKQIRSEDVIAVRGVLAKRSPETINPDLPTGEVELKSRGLRLLNASQVPPFVIDDETDANENTRLKYRYLDLRRPQSLEPLLLRYRMTKLIRDYLDGLGFIDVETPVLTKSTPEGARDYLVPSRIYHGKFYALPQSPQLFKQILMVGGLDRYFQIVKCFRDEDLRADRQPEFTQLDMELSFVQPEDVMAVVEGMIVAAVQRTERHRAQAAVRQIDLRTGDEPLRLGQAGYALRSGVVRFYRCAAELPGQGLRRGDSKGRCGQRHSHSQRRRPVAQGFGRHDAFRRDLRRQGSCLDEDYRRGLAVADRQILVRSGAKGSRADFPSPGRRCRAVFRR